MLWDEDGHFGLRPVPAISAQLPDERGKAPDLTKRCLRFTGAVSDAKVHLERVVPISPGPSGRRSHSCSRRANLLLRQPGSYAALACSNEPRCPKKQIPN